MREPSSSPSPSHCQGGSSRSPRVPNRPPYNAHTHATLSSLLFSSLSSHGRLQFLRRGILQRVGTVPCSGYSGRLVNDIENVPTGETPQQHRAQPHVPLRLLLRSLPCSTFLSVPGSAIVRASNSFIRIRIVNNCVNKTLYPSLYVRIGLVLQERP